MIVHHPELRVLALRTPTLPPATHTNCYLLGQGELTLVDPASPYDDEQAALFEALDALIAAGERPAQVFLTHHHMDHVGAAMALKARYGLPIVAHARTAELLQGEVEIDRFLNEGDVLEVGGGGRWEVLHTPGHAGGHLVLHDTSTGAMVAGDMVAAVGTIVLAPPDGDLRLYLASLARLRDLAPTVLFPAHGDDIRDAVGLLEHYIRHRHSRTDQLRAALALGPASPMELVERVYADTIPAFIKPVAEAQVRCHLRYLVEEGEVRAPEGDGEDEVWALT